VAGGEGEDSAKELNLRLIIRPDAEADMKSGYDWYEEQREGLGAQFMDEVSITIDVVHSEPMRFAATFRRTSSRRRLVA
jgi:hypothetical protein